MRGLVLPAVWRRKLVTARRFRSAGRLVRGRRVGRSRRGWQWADEPCFGMELRRYQSWDFEDWPIDADDIAGFYDQAEVLLRVSGAGDAQRPPFYQSGRQRTAVEQLVAAGWPARPHRRPSTPVRIGAWAPGMTAPQRGSWPVSTWVISPMARWYRWLLELWRRGCCSRATGSAALRCSIGAATPALFCVRIMWCWLVGRCSPHGLR